jgi:hypothetical membrane protein
MKKIEIGAVLWIFCLQYFLAEAISIWASPGRYSLSLNYISDLGALGCGVQASGLTAATGTLCSPLHEVMNSSFVLQGLLIMSGAALLRPLLPKGKLWATALLLIGVSGVGVLAVGLAPEDAAPRVHLLGAVENFIACNAGMTAMGAAMLCWRRETRTVAFVTFIAAVVGLSAFTLLATRNYLGMPEGSNRSRGANAGCVG